MHALQEFETSQLKSNFPSFKAGDTLRIHCKIKEGNKERVQIYEGVVITRHNRGSGSSFTVRKISHGIGVERIFPLHTPFIDKIELITVGKVRRSRLYYLQGLKGKKARISAVDTRGKGKGVVESKAKSLSSEAKVETDLVDVDHASKASE